MNSNTQVIKNGTATFLSHTGHCRFTRKAEQGQHLHPRTTPRQSQYRWGTTTYSSPFLGRKFVAIPHKRVTPVTPENSGECSGVPPYSTETALPALGTTNCAAVDAAVLGVLKKHERNMCSWRSSCNINLTILPLGNGKSLTALQTSIFAGRTGTSCVHGICQWWFLMCGWK